jgi:glycosyltransferase involved in cell wall biosynthesis
MVKPRKELPDLLAKTSKLNNREKELLRMLKGKDIIFFSDDWGRYPSTTQHIAKILAKENRILWIGSLGLRKPQLTISDFRRVLEKIKKIFIKKDQSTNTETVFFLNPIIIPYHDNYLIRSINNFLLSLSVKRKTRKLKFCNPILFSSTPIVADLVGKLSESISVYFCLDDYSLFKNAFDSLFSLEKKMLGKVDIVFSISDSLLKSRVPRTGNNYFLPQGVDFNHFNKDITNKIINKEKQVIGFFGLISTWVDVKLIIKCAKMYPDLLFLIIGKTEQNIDELLQFPNVEYKGEIPYNDLPNYAKLFDVGLIPFKINNLTIAVNPIKLIEYIAIGIPVVSTGLPEVEKFKDLVFVAHDDEEFIKLIPIAVLDNKPERNLLRKSMAKDFSWESIVEDISKKINSLII